MKRPREPAATPESAKVFIPQGTPEEAEQLAITFNALGHLYRQQRRKNLRVLSQATWCPHLRVAKVTKSCGKTVPRLGNIFHPEEAAALVDRGALELYVDGIPVSVQQAMSLALSPAPPPPLDEGGKELTTCTECGITNARPKGPFVPTNMSFLAVSRLSRAGYIVKRMDMTRLKEKTIASLRQMTSEPVFEMMMKRAGNKRGLRELKVRLIIAKSQDMPIPSPGMLRDLGDLCMVAIVDQGTVSLFTLDIFGFEEHIDPGLLLQKTSKR